MNFKTQGADYPAFPGGRGSLVVKVRDSWPTCHDFERSTAEDPPCREGRCTLNMPRLKRPPVDVKFPEGSELANMVTNDAKMVANIAKFAANLVAKNDANLALPPRCRQVLNESPL
ncbi:hypothetical protein TNCV_958571 [Trichonephila clavipes]|nr:hypothetical protein TNCV_958571 [Trichonephila clavipes]